MTKTKLRTSLFIKVLVTTSLLLVVSLSAVAIGGFFLLRSAATHVTVDPQAVSDLARKAVVITLRDGMTDQRVDLLERLAAMGPNARIFLPSIQQCADGLNPLVSTAACDALISIAP